MSIPRDEGAPMFDDPTDGRQHPLIAKLELFVALSAEEKSALTLLADRYTKQLGAHEDIISEGAESTCIHLVISGWACRYKQTANGKRQILGYLLPGDFCDLRGFVLKYMDHSLSTITPVKIANIPHREMLDLTENMPRVGRALWWSTLVEQAIEREWLLNLGQRTAIERMAHLFCELYVRLQAVGLARKDTCDLPMTQAELADTTGLSLVHVNRTLQDLRAEGIIELQGRVLSIPDFDKLRERSMFNAQYLHLGKEGRAFDAER